MLQIADSFSVIAFNEIDDRLAKLGKDRAWLAEQTPYSPDYIRTVLAPNSTRRTNRVMSILSAAIEAEEKLIEGEKTKEDAPPGYSAIFLSDEELDTADQASRLVSAPSLAAFCHDVIQARAREIIAEHARNSVVIEGKDLFAKQAGSTVLPTAETVIAFPEIPLIHAAAGSPISSDTDTYAPTRKVGPGRIAVKLGGDSMSPDYPHGSTVILRDRASLKNPPLKKGLIYLFDIEGEKTLKIYDSREATDEEMARGISYRSPDGSQKVRILRSINTAFPEIVVDEESINWIGWLDPKDNR